jgi:hypothetical protein
VRGIRASVGRISGVKRGVYLDDEMDSIFMTLESSFRAIRHSETDPPTGVPGLNTRFRIYAANKSVQ